ncbi:MAG: folate-binding protein [Jaaginema sp. PMC 1079.18]|nr:folate-binding protein [Jaaginema sp. PMC 1080.18]MEC4853822.1 folate-binding protein [Jaaginema sp. PMC 1079.18]MEC4865355.1 folate-binding protein [Jaaginema sp. PMC 1078.18]
MTESLQTLQTQAGATFAPDSTIPQSFGNDPEAYAAAETGVILCDRSHWDLLEITERDRLQFLHNQTTNDLKALQPGQSSQTVFVTSTARTLDLATAYITPDSVLLLLSPHQAEPLMQWLDRYLFPMDKVKIRDLSPTTACFTLIGAKSDQILQKANLTPPESSPEAAHHLIEFQDSQIRLTTDSGLALPGYTLIAPQSHAAALWSTLHQAGAIPAGETVWEQRRIQQGRPRPGCELTADYNPLEAGLISAISFNKGCYIGQETIARLNTYQGVKQRLWGVRLNALVDPATPVMLDDSKIGILTSIAETPDGILGLAYLRSKAGGEGLTVQIGNAEAEAIAVPFLRH